MTIEIFLAMLRHGLTALGVYAVAEGWADEAGWQEFIASVLGVVGFGWSVWRKYDRKQRTGSPS